MYLKRIEVKGFKSFADKIDLDFDGGITAIVGPNGSGKSNISDSIRWVLGEQSAKTLRGAKMEDIIFAGTENRKSLGCAEVTLTIDNSSKILPLDYSEVTVTRRLYRSGESEYLINNTQCRLKDIVEVFMDTGIGKDGYSLIGQGKIDEILSTRSEDRRNLFEEAAGIVKYKTRKIEAERRLESTKQNLLRITDIIEELKEQIEPLNEQSQIARKYLTLRDELKELEVNVILHNYEVSKQRLDKLVHNQEELSKSNEEHETKRNELINIIKTQKEMLSKLEMDLDKANTDRFEAEKSLESKQGNLKLLNERYENLSRDQSRVSEEIKEFETKIAFYDNQKNDFEKRKEELSIGLVEQDKKINEIMGEYSDFNEKCLEYEGQIENCKSELIQTLKDISEINNRINSSKVINENLINRRTQLEKELQIKNERIKELNIEIEKSRERVRHVNENLSILQDRLQGIVLNIKLLNESKDKLIEARNRTFDKLKASEAKYKTLQAMERDMEGFNRAVKAIITNYKDDNSVFGTVSDLIEVPRGYETAIEIALGFSVQNIIVNNEDTASRLISYLKKNNLGRATFLPLTTIKNRDISLDKEKLSSKGFLGTASKIVKYNDKFNNAISNLLGRVLVCDKLENARELARRVDYSYRIVTLDGDVINAGGSFTGGSNNLKGNGLFSRKNDIKELENIIEDSQGELSSLENKLVNINNDIESNKKNYEDLKSEIQGFTFKVKSEENVVLTIERQRKELNDYIGDIDIELEQIKLELEKNTSMIDENTIGLNSLNNKQSEIEESMNLMQVEYKNYQSGREEISDRITQEKIILTEKQKSFEAIVNKIEEIDKEKSTVNNRIKVSKRQIDENEVRIEETKLSIKNIIADIQRSAENIVIVKEEVFKIETDKKEILNKISAREKELLITDEALKDITNSIHKIEISKSKTEAEIEIQCNKLWEDYEMSIAQADKYKKDISNLSEANKKVTMLKTDIKSLGNVNVNSIEEYKRVTERFDFLQTQKDDLLKGEESLMGIIEEITKKMQVQFEEKFKIIKENFNVTFKELFGGGYADLRLENDDVLNSGIEIIVQPPGKKLQSLSLLSGGERGLAAIALLFGILKMKPTPFCVLDEIEAALDDANVNRFAQFLREYSNNTQFIMITHRKGSMAVADTLYGVTMEEKGVSKMISLKLKGGN